jgi:hypothetical protein
VYDQDQIKHEWALQRAQKLTSQEATADLYVHDATIESEIGRRSLGQKLTSHIILMLT